MKWENHTFADVDAQCIVVSNQGEINIEGNFLLAKSAEDALDRASEAGFERILLTG